jgi:lipopolysaccharide transport system ATP-binding protein
VRVASLLEVGTGFHPELTGRENIYLSGAVLGMKKNEIKRKFDEIVVFSEVEKFLDTPVKRFSSGMYVRLAFAVAAHLETEILLVDEVLAVGDAQFQRKCLGKMREISSQEGRTVIFVSHNMDAIRRLCDRAILIAHGHLIKDGEAASAIDKYLVDMLKENVNVSLQDRVSRLPASNMFKLNKVVINQNGTTPERFVDSQDIVIEFYYELREQCRRFFINIELWDTSGNLLVETFHNSGEENPIVTQGTYISKAVIAAGLLTPIAYELRLCFGIYGNMNIYKEPISVLLDVYSDGKNNMVYATRPRAGKVALPIRWRTEELS